MKALTKPELWQRIQAYSIDQPDIALPFSARLARDNDWQPDFARRAIEEYKKFVYLICISDRTMTPSEEVDAVWHLHLTYTRDYWDRFCSQTLAREIHHGPTAGGPDEDLKYREAYQATLAAYASEFSALPPADIWPDVEQRFTAAANRRVDPARYVVISRYSAKLAMLCATALLGAVAAIMAGAQPIGSIALAVVALVVVSPFVMFEATQTAKEKKDKKDESSGGGACGGGGGCSSGCGGGCGGG